MTQEIQVIDSHTAGEPTRVILSGGPLLGDGPLKERLHRFRTELDSFRTATVTEPRGSDVLVGALLCEPMDRTCSIGVIFFNNVGYLGMCGHGMIGVVETLRHCGRIGTGSCRIETPVGIVTAEVHEDGRISVGNVPSYRVASEVKIDADGVGTVVGDVAWGGNWFFLVREPRQILTIRRIPDLMRIAIAIRETVNADGFPKVDHVELYGEALDPDADSKNFVLCPGLQYDRSPCGTGTSAKLACLAADGKLAPGEPWIQEGILGTSFVGRYQWADADREKIEPVITGRAHITGEARLLLQSDDPFRWGIRGLES
jgi:4-hydroxyproline epimerase